MDDVDAKFASQAVQKLELQVQELRQFCLMLIMRIPESSPFNPLGSLQLDQRTKDYYWEKFGNYPPVQRAGE